MPTRPEWRLDPLTGRRVLIAPDRGERPIRATVACPFCEGHEGETPPEVMAYRSSGSAPDGPGWRVRVVTNRYAAVRMDAETPPPNPPPGSGEGGSGPDTFRLFGSPSPLRGGVWGEELSFPGVGVAEVFVECPHHETAFRNLAHSQATDVLRIWRDRLRHWHDDGRLAFAQVFKNEGPAAGASIEHCHSQLIGVPFLPPAIADELRHATAPCPFCRWIEVERHGPRYVTESDQFSVNCPTAPRFPGEVWVLPKPHASSFETIADGPLEKLAAVLLDLLRRVDRAFSGPDFNLIVRTAPFRYEGTFHWRIELLPRTTTTAGWEWGTGLLINTMFPEHAARLLRDAA